MKPKKVCGLLLLLMLFLTTAVSSFAQSEAAKIIITAIDGGNDTFPEINVRFRVLDNSGAFFPGLTADTLTVSENDKTYAYTRDPIMQNDGNVSIHFVINGGSRMQGTILNNAYSSIETFIDEHYLDGDYIALSLTEVAGLSPRQPFTTDTAAFGTMRETAVPCSGVQCTRPFVSTDDLVDEKAWEAVGNNPRILIYLTGLVDDERDDNDRLVDETAIETLSREAARNYVTVYTVVFDETLNSNDLANLARASGGMAVNYSDLDLLYETMINRHRPYYAAAYRTEAPGGGPRTVVLTFNGGTEDVADDISEAGVYEVEDLPLPRVTIREPEANFNWESADAIDVFGNVVFTEYGQRRLDAIIFSVNGEEKDRIDTPSGTDFTFRLTREMVANADEQQEVNLTITAVDELGLSSNAEFGTVAIIASPLATDLLPPEPTGAPTTETAAPAAPETAPDTGTLLLGGMIVMAGVLIYLVVVVSRSQKAPIKNLRNTIQANIERVTKRYRQQTEVKGYLIVLEGDNNMGKALEIFGTTRVGRSREDADLLFQQHDEHSPISRLHCTILDEEDHFKLRDEDSANGTYHNGVRLPAMSPRELYDGDEIELARVERGGVKIKFQSVQQQGEEPSYPQSITRPYASKQESEPLSSDDKRSTRAAPKTNRQPNFGQKSGDRF